jgi:ADP-dependent NAD(P)H-hydrate dehydratase / NAD(P)H-hydrate epimerase
MKLVTAAEMREIEQRAIVGGGSIETLIQRAGAAVAAATLASAPVDGEIVILAGPGNNGADGLFAARELQRHGRDVTVYAFKRQSFGGFDGSVVRSDEDAGFDRLRALLDGAAVIVDALLGIGASRPPEGPLAEILAHVDRTVRHGELRIAVDIPTGVIADTGAAAPHSFRADLTLCMAFAKRGAVVYPGAELAGSVRVADVGIPEDLAADVRVSMASQTEIAALLPLRHVDSNKGTYGRLVVVGGSRNYAGAPAMTALAAYRIGTGLVEVVTSEYVHRIVAGQVIEAVFTPVPETDGKIDTAALGTISASMSRSAAVVLGPGLGLSDVTVDLVSRVLRAMDDARLRAAVVDADGLNALARLPGWWEATTPLVLTPHPGEMGRLTGKRVSEIQENRIEVALEYAAKWSKIVVLKGARTVVAGTDGRAVIIGTGGPNLATAGTGDVLSGTIGGLLAQGCSPWNAAVAGAYVHGLAGDLLRAQYGDAGTIASDLLSQLPIARMRVVEDGGSPR